MLGADTKQLFKSKTTLTNIFTKVTLAIFGRYESFCTILFYV